MRKIIHIDMDCFYAAVEMRDNPQWQSVPLAVGGTGARSVLCTCNYIARKFGVRSAMSSIKAKMLCPELLIVPGRMDVYKDVSAHIKEIFLRFTDKIEPLSLDEAYLDVTDSTSCHGSATLIAEQIRKLIKAELNLTASAGVASNKFLAKIASDENKPDGICVVPPDKINEFVQYLPLTKIPGVGKKTAEKLAKVGLLTCADVRAVDEAELIDSLGKLGHLLTQRSRGIDNRELELSRARKSLAIETTLASDLNSEDDCLLVVEDLYNKLKIRYQKQFQKNENLAIAKQGIKLKFADFQQTTMETSSQIINNDLFKVLLSQALNKAKGRKIRLIGLTLGFTQEPINTEQLLLPW